MENIEQPFYQLPEALVEEMLLKSQKIGDFLLQSLTEVSKKRKYTETNYLILVY